MDLETELANYRAKFEQGAGPAAVAFLNSKIEELTAAFPFDFVTKVGEIVPDFALPNALGDVISLKEALDSGPVVLTFYRGSWCPYCNIQLGAYQRALPEIEAAGGRLIAISPQKPDHSATIIEQQKLTFEVLSDASNVVARKYGLVYALPEELIQAYKSFGVDLADVNGDDTWQLPIPATFVIGSNGRVVHRQAETDYRKRLSPRTITEMLTTQSGI